MTKINLRDFYPFYNVDCIIEISDEIAEAIMQDERSEQAYRRRMYRHGAQYSLDWGDGIEHEICFVSLSPCEIYERKMTTAQLHAAIAALPDKQGRRIYAHYILGISQVDIAKTEGVVKSAVSESIERGLQGIEIFLKNIL